MSGGDLENIIIPNIFTPYEDRLSLYYPPSSDIQQRMESAVGGNSA